MDHRTSARYRIAHRTHYRYAHAVAICQSQLRMSPRELEQVAVHASQTTIEPQPDSTSYHQDYFGNQVCSFAIESQHRELLVTVHSEVTVSRIDERLSETSPAWDQIARAIRERTDPRWGETLEYCFDSPLIRRDQRFREYAAKSFPADRPLMEAALDLTLRINTDFCYDTAATNVSTTTEAAFDLKAGVCQDFAHVQIACLRSLGLPARYVSGYLRTVPPAGKPRLVGADESHAWISVYAGEELGWVGFDPTNAVRCNVDHIPICLGRDYRDVSPMRGVVLGGGQTSPKVSVDVAPVE